MRRVQLEMKLLACVVPRPEPVQRSKKSAILIQAINQAASHFSGTLTLSDQELVRANQTVKRLQQSILEPDDDEGQSDNKHRRQASALDYTLAIDYTATKTVNAVVEKCKLFMGLSSQHTNECDQLLKTLKKLHDILHNIQGSAYLERYKETLEETQLYASKAYAFLEKLSFKALVGTWWMPNKAESRFDDFIRKFSNQEMQLCEEFEKSQNDLLLCETMREDRPSFGVTTFLVVTHNTSSRLYRKKRVVIPLIDAVDGNIGYTVEMSYPRTWRNKGVAMSARVESNDRGYSQTLQADLVQLERGSWGWEEAQDTVTITYEDVLVANVASTSGALLTYGNHSHNDGGPKRQKYRTSVQIVGSSRIDLDLQDLYITGVKQSGYVYYKCFVNSESEEILAIYRYHRGLLQKSHGVLHVVGRGNQPGLRHLLVSVFSSLGFTSVI